jgi:CheY-like chemotaxis protein
MTFAGQQPAQERSPHAIAPLVERAVDICRRMFDRHIVLEMAIADDLPEVLCSENEIEQILMNLLLNARDAVLAKGRAAPRIRIKCDLRRPPGAFDDDRQYVRIQVEDDGTGMSADVISRVFDPFFTTKEIGRGTGLGLATSYAIARELGGTIACSSTEGLGAVFDLFLPVSTRESQRVPAAGTKSTQVLPRSRVLVVDDEPPIRRSLAILLDDAGFDVDTVGNGEDAVARLSSSPGIDVVLLDRSMPGAPGETFVPRMRVKAPRTKIILFTGRAVEPSLAKQVDGVLQKPALATDLIHTITSVLDDAS